MLTQESTERPFPPQEQEQPGRRSEVQPKPRTEPASYRPSEKLRNKVAFVTGGDSGIGRAVAILYAKEGADVVIVYKEEHKDAEDTREEIERHDRRCLTIAGDIGKRSFCQQALQQAIDQFGKLNILVNNAAEQHVRDTLDEITTEDLERTFATNIFSMFYMVQAAVPHLEKGDTIINTTSVTAYLGHPKLLDYSATKGAIVAFTRSLALRLADHGIRVNGVAPGPVWTPLIPASFDAEHVETFGENTPLKRAGQPEEVAPCFLFLASDDSSYMTGQILHPNGGRMVNG